MDDVLKDKIGMAVHQTLTTMVRSMVSAGMPPEEAVATIQDQLLAIRKQVESAIERGVKPRGTTTDVAVRDDGGKGEAAEAQVVAETSGDRFVANLRRERGGESAPWPRAETHAEWTDDDTARYGVEPRTGPGLDPNERF